MLANRTFTLHTILTILALWWSILIAQPGLAVAFAALWVLAFVTWLEWHHTWNNL